MLWHCILKSASASECDAGLELDRKSVDWSYSGACDPNAAQQELREGLLIARSGTTLICQCKDPSINTMC